MSMVANGVTGVMDASRHNPGRLTADNRQGERDPNHRFRWPGSWPPPAGDRDERSCR